MTAKKVTASTDGTKKTKASATVAVEKPEKPPRGYEYKQFLVKKVTDEKATKKTKRPSN